MRQPYFKTVPEDPKPLVVTTHRTVRFEEVDAVGMVWHGRYPSYFEDARVKLGDKFGIGYQDFIREKIMAPIKSMHIDYHHPLRFNERFSITAMLHWSDAVRINFEFRIHNAENRLTTTGYTVQLMLDHNADKSMHIDYHHPLRFNERFSITAMLHWSDAVRINFEFRIHNAENRLTTTGYTVQLMLDHNADVLFVTPKFYQALCDRWRAGELA